MGSTLLDKLRTFRVPAVAPVDAGRYLVAQLEGVDFGGFFNSPEFAFDSALDARFGKLLVRTAGQLLGGDACGAYAYLEQTQISLFIDAPAAAKRWQDIADLQHFLVGSASAKLTLLLDECALFICRMFAFPSSDIALGYFAWRQQEAYVAALDGYCREVLTREKGQSAAAVSTLLDGLGPLEKEEILRQNEIDYAEVPAWHRYGTGVYLNDGGQVVVDTSLPTDQSYGPYILEHARL